MRTPRFVTPIEAERQRIAQEQQRRLAAQKRPLEDLSAHSEHYFVRIRNAAARVDTSAGLVNRGYQQPESRPQDKSARPSWNASPRFPGPALDYQPTGELPAIPDTTRPVPPGRERPRERAPRRGGKARAAEQGGLDSVHPSGGGAEQTPTKSRPSGDGGDGAAGGGEYGKSPLCELRCAALRRVQGIVARPSARPALGDRAAADAGGGATASPFRYAAAALRKLSRRQRGEGSAVGGSPARLDGPLQLLAGFLSPGGSRTRHAPPVLPVSPGLHGSTVKVPPPWQCPRSAPAPPQGVTGGSGWLDTLPGSDQAISRPTRPSSARANHLQSRRFHRI